MTMKHLMAFALIVAASVFANAQAPVQPAAQIDGVRHLSRGFAIHMMSVVITGEEADVNDTTGRIDFYGTVKMRPAFRPTMTEVPATNRAGAPFPTFPPVVMQFRGNFQITIDRLTISADEADVNTRTGDTELRGHVFALRSR